MASTAVEAAALPALGAVVLSPGVSLGDIVIAGTGIGAIGIALVIGLGKAITKLF